MVENLTPEAPQQPQVPEYTPGEIVIGKVTGITSFGAFVKLPAGVEGLVHISEIANTYVTDIGNFIKLGDDVKVKVLGKNQKGKFDLSIKQTLPREVAPSSAPAPRYERGDRGDRGDRKKDKNYEPGSFDELMHNFMKVSEEIQLDVRRNMQYRQGVKKKGGLTTNTKKKKGE
jgi:S1 RNA binding domain protein